MKRILVQTWLFLLLIMVMPLYAEATGKVVIVTLGRTSLAQLAEDEAMAPWLSRGSAALLNTATGARPTSEHLYVTMGAGSRAVGTESAKLAFMADEEYGGLPAKDIFLRRQGLRHEGSVLHLGMAKLSRANRALRHPVRPGLLGDTLREGGKITAVIGNADGHGVAREAVSLLADSRGQAGLGDVSRTVLVKDPAYPFGWRLDREKVWQTFQRVFPAADVILVDWGDTVRLDEYRPLLRDSVARELQGKIFQDISWFLTRAFVQMGPGDILILLSAVPPRGESGGGLFGFMAALGGPFPPGGLLSSATTRRPGLAAVTDVAPLVLEQSGLGIPGEMLGRSVGFAQTGGMRELLAMQREVDRVFRLRPPLMRAYVFFQIVFVLGALLNLFARIVPVRRFEPFLLGLLTIPLLLLYLPLYAISMVMGFVAVIVAAVAAVIFLQRVTAAPVQRFAVIAAATSLSIVADLLRNAPLNKVSVLGYDPVSGARYYGLGNEYMGVLVGATVLAGVSAAALWPRRRSLIMPLSALYFLAVLLLIAAPDGGANFGGTLTALAAFVVTLPVLWKVRPGWRTGAAILAVILVVAGAAAFLNMRVPQHAQSHLGRTITLLQAEGWQTLQDVVARKAAMNIRLFRFSQWSRAFLAFLLVLAVLFYRPRGVLRDLHKSYPDLAAGFLGIIAGSVTAFLVNDSGVVAAATTLLYAGVPIIILASQSVEQGQAIITGKK